ncbi:A24 family peptidase [Pseudobacteroides cellulosolvens]|uniref:Peptidase A24A prepilin type IV n=1 Tax=Pseudobacteroides cellulosolvens ATCC 35603 = DSM 2933 TaxID=398512 RepID=A0A0L6JH83_9FIRM|nr:A24 family peptidase [Pseudobacteroides cellulosolvens]KNY25075.1 peptidase A24A prepilin type IV [Pseudobacteroides cellulosolvens ATCC 35603 = DSM 2933]
MEVKIALLFMVIALAVYNDIRSFKIKNLITYPAVIFGIVINTYFYGIHGLKDTIIAVFIPIIVLFIFFTLRMLGAGDIKLYCAIGAIMGCKFVAVCLVYSFLVGGFISVTILLLRKNVLQRFKILFNYIKATIVLMKVDKYQDFTNDKNGLFRFSYAVLGGTIISLVDMFLFSFSFWGK